MYNKARQHRRAGGVPQPGSSPQGQGKTKMNHEIIIESELDGGQAPGRRFCSGSSLPHWRRKECASPARVDVLLTDDEGHS